MNTAWKRFFWWWWRNNTWKKCIKRDGIKKSAFLHDGSEREKNEWNKKSEVEREREKKRWVKERERGIKRWEDAQEKEAEDAKEMFRMFKKGFSSVIPFTFFLPLSSFFLPLLSLELHEKKRVLELGGEENIWHEKNSTLFLRKSDSVTAKEPFSLSFSSFFPLFLISSLMGPSLFSPSSSFDMIFWSDAQKHNSIILIHDFLKMQSRDNPSI